MSRLVFEPGWRWSQTLKEKAGTESCQKAHLQYLVSGQLGIRMDDGTESIFDPGYIIYAGPGHDAWTVGDEPAILIDFGAALAS